MYLQVVYNLRKTKQNQVEIVDVEAKPIWNYFKIERKVRPQQSKVLGHRDYDIPFMYEIPEDEYNRLVEKYYRPS